MNLTPYVDSLRRELSAAAEAGGQEPRALAERLAGALESAARLALLEALSAAADEITRDLAPGSVDIRLRGRDPTFVVTPPPSSEPFEPAAEGRFEAPPAAPPAPPPDGEEGGTSRISLRVPEQLKSRIDEAAAREDLSVNAWLVRAVSAALEPDGGGRRSGWLGGSQSQRRYQGWVRS